LGAPDSGKAIIFQAKAEFFGQKSAAKNEKNVFIKRKTDLIFRLARLNAGIFRPTYNYWVG